MIGETRPWGHFEILTDEPDHKVKRLVVEPGKRLSLQRHQRRSEHWFVVAGTPEVTRDDEVIRLGPGDAIDIPQGARHRIANPGQDDWAESNRNTGAALIVGIFRFFIQVIL